MTIPTWLALLAVLAGSAAIVAALRRRARRATSDAGRRFLRHPGAAAGVFVLVCFATIALTAPLVAPYRPSQMLGIDTLQNRPPTWLHLLGTDLYSRDTWSRVAFGARVSLGVGTLGMLVSLTAGALVGAVAGYFRRRVDTVLMRLVDIGLAVPRIFVVLVVIAVGGRLGLPALVLLLGLTGWFPTSRLVRAEVLSLRERPFTDAALSLGATPWRVIFRHILPNAAAPLIVSAALGIGNVMLLESALSYLGVGVQPPDPSWGNMIADGRDQLATAPWTTIFPGLAIALTVMALNAVGDGLRDALDPRRETA